VTEHGMETRVAIPAMHSLILAVSLAACTGVAAVIWQDMGESVNWRVTLLTTAATLTGAFCAAWLLFLWAQEAERRAGRVQAVQSSVTTCTYDALPLIPPEFGVRDARRFVTAALIRIDGRWQSRPGGNTQRAMQERGWPKEEWERAIDWLTNAGVLKWKNPLSHTQGTEWDFEALDRLMEVHRE